MATLQPSYPSERRHRSRSPGAGHLRPKYEEESRHRSRSRTPKPGYIDIGRKYGPNEKRQRRPPLSPSIEDGGFDDDGVRMRGKLEQKPVLIEADGASDNAQQGSSPVSEIYTSSSGSHDEPRRTTGPPASAPKRAQENERPQNGSARLPQNAGRGRQNLAKVDTRDHRDRSSTENPPQLERARSPYSSGPRRPDPRDHRYSTDSLLSPTLDSPRGQHTRQYRPHSQTPPTHSRDEALYSNDKDGHGPRSPRPNLDRRASAMPDLGKTPPSSPVQSRKKSGHYYSSEESDYEAHRRSGKSSHHPSQEQIKPLTTRQASDHHQYERRPSSRNPAPPPTSPPTASDHARPHGLNREALLNGAAASLGGLLDGPQRKASPRASPQVSPNTSPYPSPPRTPPEPHRANHVSSLKSEKSNSRPSSPLSSAHQHHPTRSTPALAPEMADRPARFKPVSRATSPIPSSRRPEAHVPQIDVRSPSPLPPPQHAKTMSQETNGSHTPSRYLPASASSNLRVAAPPLTRQRSMSTSDTRSPRPAGLAITAPPQFDLRDVEYLSPTSETTPAMFRGAQHGLLSPTAPGAHFRNSISNPGGSANRSHSAVPKPDSTPQLPASTTMQLPLSRPRSRSSAPAPEVPYSDQRHPDPTQFPPCIHPKPMTDYRDWFTIAGCEAFVVCRDCRYKIFGQGYARQLKHFTPPSGSTAAIQCAINDPWMRMACLASILKGANDLKPVVDLATENEDRSACPQKTPARRDWYYLRDQEANENLADFRVCSHCAHSIYTLFPVLDRCFQRAEVPDEELLLCSVRSADPSRFAQYVNHCEKAQQAALATGKRHPDMSDFIWYHKKETVISECTKDQVLIGRDWHRHPELPQCTVCEECYYEVVRPQMKRGYGIARAFTPAAKHINDGVSCSLYSPRMKEVFKIACEDDDFKYLKTNVAKRWDLQVQVLAAKMAVQKYPRDKGAQHELDELMRKWHELEKEKYYDSDSD